jgi:Na+-transporting NADH:ubiquinone oxidoreductase subunit NqrA
MIRAIVLSVMMVVAVSAQANPDYDQEFTAQKEYEEMRITWVVVDDIVQACATLFHNKPYNPSVVACSQRSGIVCTIYTQRKLDLAILGHEIRHCYDGNWHK